MKKQTLSYSFYAFFGGKDMVGGGQRPLALKQYSVPPSMFDVRLFYAPPKHDATSIS